jgi:hypothetical protein
MAWSPKMDLLALTTSAQSLEVIRVSFCLEKVFTIQEDHLIIAIEFSSDSLSLLYGRSDGAIFMVRVENGELLF